MLGNAILAQWTDPKPKPILTLEFAPLPNIAAPKMASRKRTRSRSHQDQWSMHITLIDLFDIPYSTEEFIQHSNDNVGINKNNIMPVMERNKMGEELAAPTAEEVEC